MGAQKEKLVARFRTIPADFTWDDLCRLLRHFGYTAESGSGSGRCFVKQNGHVIHIHEPHPAKVVKKYALRIVYAKLKENGDIE